MMHRPNFHLCSIHYSDCTVVILWYNDYTVVLLGSTVGTVVDQQLFSEISLFLNYLRRSFYDCTRL